MLKFLERLCSMRKWGRNGKGYHPKREEKEREREREGERDILAWNFVERTQPQSGAAQAA